MTITLKTGIVNHRELHFIEPGDSLLYYAIFSEYYSS